MKIEVTRSNLADLSEVLQLLQKVNLPTEGVAEHFADFFVAREGRRLVGCVGLERHGNYALLRSLAVDPDYRGQQIGINLTLKIITYAQANIIRTMALLTTIADQFFARHFDFSETERDQFDAVFSASPEWNLPRCSAAIFMTLSLPNENQNL